MIEERRKLLLILHFKCNCIVEQCAHIIFVRKNVKNCIFFVGKSAINYIFLDECLKSSIMT